MTSEWADEIIVRGMKDRCSAFVKWSKMRDAARSIPVWRIYCTDRGDFIVPGPVERATRFRKSGDVDRRYANAKWREWLKDIGEAK